MLNIQTQRGCAFHCCYCTYPLLEGRAHRRRPAEAVAEEFEQLQTLGARYAFIVDSVFNSSPRHVAEICEAILARNLKLKWGCFLRPQGLTRELMKLMARAGLSHIEFGSDSFCDEVLEAYEKGLSFDDIAKSSELAHQEKLDYCHFLIAGGPGETRETLRQGFERSTRLVGAVMMAVVGCAFIPARHLHQRALAEGVINSETNLLTPDLLPLSEAHRRADLCRAPGACAHGPQLDHRRPYARLRQPGEPAPPARSGRPALELPLDDSTDLAAATAASHAPASLP